MWGCSGRCGQWLATGVRWMLVSNVCAYGLELSAHSRCKHAACTTYQTCSHKVHDKLRVRLLARRVGAGASQLKIGCPMWMYEIRKFSTETRSTTGNHAAAANAASASASASASFFELAFLPAVGEEAPEQAREYARLDLAAARQWPPRVVLVLALHFRGCCSSLAQKSSKAGKRNPELQMEAGCRVGN
ncbi:hypothetical protein GUJ93_ZPchr0003g16633 [Zizania palustris]|uniref:Secreted protein n=1 Tax=Zizania palustris TaxID=103762 RepID=A0A8J5S9T9_ZIZPA|nr:hypothetical protein GUJ93_ZPchr0003g16633 [Zizania palustris]